MESVSMALSMLVSFTLSRLLWGLVSFTWLWKISTHSLSLILPLNDFIPPQSFLSWTSEKHITSFEFKREMNGKQLSTLHLAIMNICLMPFGLTKAPAVFQVLVNDILWDMLCLCVPLWYSYFFLQYRRTQTNVRLVLQRLLKNKLFVKEWGQVRSDPSRVQAVTECSTIQSQTITEVPGFCSWDLRLQLCYGSTYTAYIHHYPLCLVLVSTHPEPTLRVGFMGLYTQITQH